MWDGFCQARKGEGWITGRQALHSGGVGMRINLFVVVTLYKFYRAVLYAEAQLNSEVTRVLKEMEMHLIRVNVPCWVSCDTWLCHEDVFFEAKDTLAKVSPVWFFAETVLAWIQTYLHFVSYSVCFLRGDCNFPYFFFPLFLCASATVRTMCWWDQRLVPFFHMRM